MIRRVTWRALALAAPILLASCDAERIAAPARSAAPVDSPVPQMSMTGTLLCTDPDPAAFGRVVCTMDEGSAMFTTPLIIRKSQHMQLTLRGASGGSAPGFSGGHGGILSAGVAVPIPGRAYEVRVGGAGGNAGTGSGFGDGGANGGGAGGRDADTDYRAAGGGGQTDLRFGGNVMIAAGGGGGQGGGAGPSGADGGFAVVNGYGGSNTVGGAPGITASIGGCALNANGGSAGAGGAGANTFARVSGFFTFTCLPGAGGGAGMNGGGGGGAVDSGLGLPAGNGGGGANFTRSGTEFTSVSSGRLAGPGNGDVTIIYWVPLEPPKVTVTIGDAIDATTQWYNQQSSGTDGVTVNVKASDPDLVYVKCWDGATLVHNVTTTNSSFTLNDGSHSITCQASNGLVGLGDNSTAFPLAIDVDQTTPALAPSISPFPVTLGGTYTASANATDATSGVASTQCGGVNASAIGAFTVSCSATDNAGNSASTNLGYNVIFAFSGFFEPVNIDELNVVPAGRGVPVKFSLAGDQGLGVLSWGFPISQVVTCEAGAPTDVIEETVATGSSGLTYDAKTGVYTYVWKTDKSWVGCRQLIVRLSDGTSHTATFKFTK